MAANETASPRPPPRQVPVGSIRELLHELRERPAAGPTTDSPATVNPRQRPTRDPASHRPRRLPAADRYAHPDDQDPPLPPPRIAETNPFMPVASSRMQHSNSSGSADVDHNPRRGRLVSLTAPPPAAAVPNPPSDSDEGIRRIRLARGYPRRQNLPDPAALEITTTTTTTTTETIITTTTTTTTTTVQRVAE